MQKIAPDRSLCPLVIGRAQASFGAHRQPDGRCVVYSNQGAEKGIWKIPIAAATPFVLRVCSLECASKCLTPPTLSERRFINSCEVNTARPSEILLLGC